MLAPARPSHRSAKPAAATVPAVASPQPAGMPLAMLLQELCALCQHVAALPALAAGAAAASAGGASHAVQTWRHTLQQLEVHLFLTASQLLPVWRDLCRDTREVDRMEVRLAQLSALVTQTLGAGAGDPMAEARCAVLAEALQDHRVRSVVLLRALDAVADADSLQALAEVWADQGARLRQALRRGQAPAMDNEDADPVGRPPR